MPQGGYRVVEQHARPCVAHHEAHPFLHLRLVAMDGAEAAGGFSFAEAATGQACMGIGQQFATRRTQFSVAFLVAAIQTYHLLDGLLFAFDACRAGRMAAGIHRAFVRLGQVAAVFAGGVTHVFLEQTVEVLGILESQFVGNLAHRLVRACYHFFGEVDDFVLYVFLG